jgi:biotin transporter BioY
MVLWLQILNKEVIGMLNKKNPYKHRKWVVFATVVVILILCLVVGVKIYGDFFEFYGLDIFNLTLTFINTALLIIMASVIIKLEQDLFHHHNKLEEHHKRLDTHHKMLSEHHKISRKR